MSSAIPPAILIVIVTRPLSWYHELPVLPSAAALVASMLVPGAPRVATGVAAHPAGMALAVMWHTLAGLGRALRGWLLPYVEAREETSA